RATSTVTTKFDRLKRTWSATPQPTRRAAGPQRRAAAGVLSSTSSTPLPGAPAPATPDPGDAAVQDPRRPRRQGVARVVHRLLEHGPAQPDREQDGQPVHGQQRGSPGAGGLLVPEKAGQPSVVAEQLSPGNRAGQQG